MPIKKRSRKPAPRADKPGLETRKCLCPCQREFTTRDKRKKYYEHSCFYAHKIELIRTGITPPDSYETCSICGEKYPYWKMLGKRGKKICSKKECWEKGHNRGMGKNPPVIKPPNYNARKAAIIRRTFCGSCYKEGRMECKDYSKCLEPCERNEPTFTEYFRTNGKCRK